MSPGVLADTGYDQIMENGRWQNAVRSKETRQII